MTVAPAAQGGGEVAVGASARWQKRPSNVMFLKEGGIDPSADLFALEQFHAADRVVVGQKGLPLMVGDLAALIGMNHHRYMRLAAS